MSTWSSSSSDKSIHQTSSGSSSSSDNISSPDKTKKEIIQDIRKLKNYQDVSDDKSYVYGRKYKECSLNNYNKNELEQIYKKFESGDYSDFEERPKKKYQSTTRYDISKLISDLQDLDEVISHTELMKVIKECVSSK